MTEILTDLSPSSLAVAIKANLYAYFYDLRHAANATVRESADGFRWLTGIPIPWFNGLLSIREPSGNVAQLIEETLAFFRSNRIAGFTWWLAPHLQPDAWAEQLLPRGFQYDDHTPGMAVHLDALPPLAPHPLITRQVTDRQALAEWARILTRGFEMPENLAPQICELFDVPETAVPARHYLGFLDDRPVATASLLLAAGVAGIYNVATVAEARHQGIGSVMTLIPLLAAREMGYHTGILQSSEMGYAVYQRLGFKKLTQVDYFQWRDPDPA